MRDAALPATLMSLAAAVTLAASLWQPARAGGWVLALVGVALLLMDPRLRNGQLLACVSLIWLVRQAVAVSDAWTLWFSRTQIDAMAFAHSGRKLAEFHEVSLLTMGSDFYKHLLGAVHTLAGLDPLVGRELSVLAFCLSVVVFVRLLDETGGGAPRWLPLALFGLIPSSVMLHSVTLREPFQLLALMLTVWAALRARRGSSWWLVVALAGAFAAALLHQVLLLVALAMMLVVIAWPGAAHGAAAARPWRLAGLAVAGLGLLAVIALAVPVPAGDDYLRLLARGQVEALVSYREAIDAALPRTSWGVTFPSDSLAGLSLAVCVNYAMYLLAPFPWWVHNAQDLYASMEALVRAAALAFALLVALRADARTRRDVLLWLALYVVVTGVWSLGTTNWGQALRHHTVSNWVLLLAAWTAVAGIAPGGPGSGRRHRGMPVPVRVERPG